MRSLLLCSRPPWPLHGGDRIRTWHLARALADLGEVTVVAARGPREDPAEIERGLSFARRVLLPVLSPLGAAARVLGALPGREPLQQAIYRSASARAATALALRDPTDVVLAHLLRTVPWLPERSPPLVVDIQDALCVQYREARGWGWHRPVMALESARLGLAERRAAARAQATTFISERDRRAVGPEGRSAILPAVLDPEAFALGAAPPRPGTIGFAAQLRTATNRDMLLHFVDAVFPLVRSARRDAELRIIGRGADAAVRRLGSRPGVTVVGAVDDVAAELRSCWLTVCPQRFGSGVQNKVLQSLSVGTPAVITPPVQEGLGRAPGTITARLDRSFAVAVTNLLGDGEGRRALSEEGARWVRREHGPRALTSALSSLLSDVAPARPA